ncbi:ABC transporter permease [Tepidanaerobacter syntrophicus]|uniref:ABC transporter permease n=1 Tax=Tepidanaerobacter syntrophicus TaxID=224999 RepID=UPI002490F87F|nr:ABC transporter permease [Tepidanaerobacter syntrophicus]
MKNRWFLNNTRKFQRFLILLIIILTLTILQPRIFPTIGNFKSILLAVSIYGVMICGAIYPILLGGIDLSVGAVAALSGACTVMSIVNGNYSDFSVIKGVLLGLIAGALVGLMHGIVITSFKVPPFLITLASMNIVYGITQLLTNSLVISCLKPLSFTFIGGGRVLGIPVPIYIYAFMTFISYLVLNKTVFGRSIYCVGGNPVASELSGISSKKVTIASYIFSGFTAAIAGIILASMNQQAIAKAAQGYENDVLTAIVVGGTSLMGGEGSMGGAVFGTLLVGLLNNGLRLMGVPSIYHTVVKGTIIIIAVAFDVYSRSKNR